MFHSMAAFNDLMMDYLSLLTCDIDVTLLGLLTFRFPSRYHITLFKLYFSVHRQLEFYHTTSSFVV